MHRMALGGALALVVLALGCSDSGSDSDEDGTGGAGTGGAGTGGSSGAAGSGGAGATGSGGSGATGSGGSGATGSGGSGATGPDDVCVRCCTGMGLGNECAAVTCACPPTVRQCQGIHESDCAGSCNTCCEAAGTPGGQCVTGIAGGTDCVCF